MAIASALDFLEISGSLSRKIEQTLSIHAYEEKQRAVDLQPSHSPPFELREAHQMIVVHEWGKYLCMREARLLERQETARLLEQQSMVSDMRLQRPCVCLRVRSSCIMPKPKEKKPSERSYCPPCLSS